MSKIDLHLHSHFSLDGELSVGEIVTLCKAREMDLASITDHNSAKSIGEIRKDNKGLCFIAGIELDCCYNGMNLHILGYGIDSRFDEFNAVGEDIIVQEKEAAVKKIDLFKNFSGIPVDSGAIIASSKTGVITGEIIAEYVLAMENASTYELLKPYLPGGEKSDMPNAHFYWDFFSSGKPADVPIRIIPLEEALELIHSAHGIAVLAHPGQSLSGNYHLLDGIIAKGIDGIEVFSSYHSPEDAAYFSGIAGQKKLLISCGSDFHGKNKPLIQICDHGATINDAELLEGFKKLGLPLL